MEKANELSLSRKRESGIVVWAILLSIVCLLLLAIIFTGCDSAGDATAAGRDGLTDGDNTVDGDNELEIGLPDGDIEKIDADENEMDIEKDEDKENENCIPDSQTSSHCDGGDVYWFDSCGNKEAIKEECGTLPCIDDVCAFPEGYCQTSQCWFVTPTGQASCYDWTDFGEELVCPGGIPAFCGSEPPIEGCGQDAQYENKSRNFTCYDETGLEVSCLDLGTAIEGEVVVDSLTGLMWQRTKKQNLKWQQAMDFCGTTFNSGVGYFGYTDWRLPNPHELLSLVDLSKYGPVIDTAIFSETWGPYWSSSTAPFYQSEAWGVGYRLGTTIRKLKNYLGIVRCVRGGPKEASSGAWERFIISNESGQDVAKDRVTDLIWQMTYGPESTWVEALAYCENLDYANQTDWRLPNKNELTSLVLFGSKNPASAFPNMISEEFWSSSSESVLDSTFLAFSVEFSSGSVSIGYKDRDYYFVRCVRGGLPTEDLAR